MTLSLLRLLINRELSADLGNDPNAISEILDFQRRARAEIEDHIKTEKTDKSVYSHPTSVKGRMQKLESDLKDKFNRLVNIELRQKYIDRNGGLQR